MAEIVQFSAAQLERKRGYPTFKKVVDGQVVECVDVDSLSPAQRAAWLADNPKEPSNGDD